MTHGELGAQILYGDRAQASAPPDVSRDLRLTAQAEADAWQQAADAQIRHDPAGSASATALARHMATQREQLETANACYQTWAAGTSSKKETAGKARAELERRGLAQQTAEQRQPGAGREPQTPIRDPCPWFNVTSAARLASQGRKARVLNLIAGAADAIGPAGTWLRTPGSNGSRRSSR
jgi:hypothetical protein